MPPRKAYCSLTNGPQFAHAEVFNRDGKLVSVSATKFIVTEPSEAVNAGMTKQTDRGAATCAEALSSSAVWVVGWLLSP